MGSKKIKLELKNMSKKYGKNVIVNGMDLTVYDGEFFVILGPSGTGKSTLLKMIAGIETIDRGKVVLDGKDVTDIAPNKRNMAMVFQNYALYPNMTVYNNIAFPLKMHGIGNIDRTVRATAKLLGISNVINSNVTRISGGQKQRVALARAIARKPSLFLLDEPLSNLDARVRYTAREELKHLRSELKETFLYVTHDQSDARLLADRMGIMHNGKFEQVGTFDEIYYTPSTPWVGDFIGSFPMNFLPGSDLGKKGYEQLGFRPEWVSVVKSGGVVGKVMTREVISGTYFLFCEMKHSAKPIVIKSPHSYANGEDVHFKIKYYDLYNKNKLVKSVTPFHVRR